MDKDTVVDAVGNRYLFKDIYLEHQPKVICYLSIRYLNHWTHKEIEDVVQETFIIVYKSICKFRGDSELGTWILSIAIRAMSNYHRNITRKVCLTLTESRLDDIESLMDNLNHHEITPERSLHSKETMSLFEEFYNSLTEDNKLMFEMWEDDISYEDIAIIMNIPIGTVRSRLFRTRAKFKDIFREAVFLY
jgi:RNA polymerase sigma-70 factor (ECF subfamily)